MTALDRIAELAQQGIGPSPAETLAMVECIRAAKEMRGEGYELWAKHVGVEDEGSPGPALHALLDWHDSALTALRAQQEEIKHLAQCVIDSEVGRDQQAQRAEYAEAAMQDYLQRMLQLASDKDRAEAERDALQRIIDSASGIMHGNGVEDQGQAWDHALRLLDAARAKEGK